ncbi:MAG TPA: hypothetical protein VK561_01245, partial [Bradyrhizobium sp.]|nr:hypothetical protein [Bradyrhizobium sp.]
ALETTDTRRREILRTRPQGLKPAATLSPAPKMLVLNDDVALVHPDPELDPLVHRHFSIALVPALSQIPKTLFRGLIECDPGVLPRPILRNLMRCHMRWQQLLSTNRKPHRSDETTHSIASYCPPF